MSAVEARLRARTAETSRAWWQRQKRRRRVPRPLPSRYAAVVAAVAERHGITVAAIKGAARSRPVAAARHEAMAALHEMGLSMMSIGHALGGRDHTTVLYGIRRHAERLARAPGAGGRA